MANKSRHDFSKPVIRLLRDNAGDTCSNPECRVVTRGASSLKDSPTSIGVAAHICAAAPGAGSKRYDHSMSKEVRSSYDNGIWLCQSCSKRIDTDDVKYTVDLLKSWRVQAELYSHEVIGKRLYSQEEVDRKIIGGVVGVINDPSGMVKIRPGAIAKAYADSLVSPEDDFFVTLNINDGVETLKIEKKSGDPLKLKIETSNPGDKETEVKCQNLLDRGTTLECNASQLKIHGLPLIDRLPNLGEAKVRISAKPKKLNASLYVIDSIGSEHFVESFNASMVSGQKGSLIEATFLYGLVRYREEFENNQIGESYRRQFNLTFDLSCWIGRDVQKIPYFSQISKIVSMFGAQGSMDIRIDPDEFSTPVAILSSQDKDLKGLCQDIAWIIRLIEKIRLISKKVGNPIFIHNVQIPSEDAEKIIRYADILLGKAEALVSEGSTIGVTGVELNDPDYFDCFRNEIVAELRFVSAEMDYVTFFGNRIGVPRLETRISGFHPLFYCDLEKNGRLAMLMVAAKNSRASFHLLDDEWIG